MRYADSVCSTMVSGALYAIAGTVKRTKRGVLNNAVQCAATGAVASVLLLLLAAPVQADTLDEVRERGVVVCGVNPDLPGFSHANSLGAYSSLDIDFCRAVASAVLGDREAAEFVPVNSIERFDALVQGRFDILARNTTWTLEREVKYGEFVGVNYYDGQGFMVPKQSGIRSALELDNQPICVSRGTTTELNAIDYFAVSRMRYKPVYFDDNIETVRAYEAGKCTALTTDRSGLAAQRTSLAAPAAHVVLPEVISKEPLGPMVRSGDPRWANVVRWTLHCMVNAEEMGLSSDTIAGATRSSLTPAARRLLGEEGGLGTLLGLDDQWCFRVIRDIGHYGESYERNVGPSTPLSLDRGVNRLWTDGGLLYAPPIR